MSLFNVWVKGTCQDCGRENFWVGENIPREARHFAAAGVRNVCVQCGARIPIMSVIFEEKEEGNGHGEDQAGIGARVPGLRGHVPPSLHAHHAEDMRKGREEKV